MINFTVGPVQASDEILSIGSEQVPYFRTPEFSSLMKENERMMLEFADAPEKSRVVFLTGSGTAAMESTVMNLFREDDSLLVINGGSFGARFCQICDVHHYHYEAIRLSPGKTLKKEDLEAYEGKGFTGLLVNLCETSTGVLYDIQLLSDFCRRNGMLLVVDAISAFLATPFSMKESGAAVMITGSQKALSCAPGISFVVMSPEAVDRINGNPTKCVYLDLKDHLKNMERGQTPFTPAVGILRQIHLRLSLIEEMGGAKAEIARVQDLASDFRNSIKDLPFDLFPESPSPSVTALKVRSGSAYDLFSILKDEYGIWICPNGGDLKDLVFRVGHIGHLTEEDNATLVAAFKDLQKRGILA